MVDASVVHCNEVDKQGSFDNSLHASHTASSMPCGDSSAGHASRVTKNAGVLERVSDDIGKDISLTILRSRMLLHHEENVQNHVHRVLIVQWCWDHEV